MIWLLTHRCRGRDCWRREERWTVVLCSRRNRDYLQMAKHQKTHRNTPAESVWSSQNKQRFCVGCSYEASGGRTQTTKSGVGQKIENYLTDSLWKIWDAELKRKNVWLRWNKNVKGQKKRRRRGGVGFRDSGLLPGSPSLESESDSVEERESERRGGRRVEEERRRTNLSAKQRPDLSTRGRQTLSCSLSLRYSLT